MPHSRTEKQIRAEIAQVELSKALYGPSSPVLDQRCADRLEELKRELRSLDDTPVMPYRPASVPPSAPRGRKGPPPIPPHLRKKA